MTAASSNLYRLIQLVTDNELSDQLHDAARAALAETQGSATSSVTVSELEPGQRVAGLGVVVFVNENRGAGADGSGRGGDYVLGISEGGASTYKEIRLRGNDRVLIEGGE